jgi:undecaprenyl diphosphate synthase
MKLRSIAIIPDGNRRYAASNRLSFQSAYMRGFENVEKVIEWSKGTEIRDLTFWALSLENYKKRSNLELKILFSLIKKYIRNIIKEGTFTKKKIRVRFFGKIDLLPKDLQSLMRELENQTLKFEKTLGIAIAYSGREEILNAAKRIAVDFSGKGDKVAKLTEGDFEKYLYAPVSPDLIIRTGSVSRLSGFLPWQTAYSELYFSKKLWPEFCEADFNDAVEFYEETQRRFGR